MAEKKLMVVIGAKAGEFNKVMGQVQRDTRQISKAFKDVGRDLQTAGKGMTAAFTVPILAVGGAAVKAYGDFEQTMTQSTAIMGDLSDDMRKQMETAAREIGKTTKFGATEAAEAFEFLALAGLSAEQSIAALPQVAAFAQAGNFDLARATDLATDAQAALGMSSKNAQQNLTNLTRVTDVLTRAATLANANTEQFSESLTEKAGTALRSLKKDVEEGAAVLAVFADQGVKGGQAGTTLNATLEGLSRQAIINKDVFAAHNVEVFDGNGQMKNMADITADLEKSLGGMSTEEQRATLMKMGFNRQALNGIQMLMGNSDAIREYEAELRKAGGTTQDVADKQLNNLWDQLGLIKDRLIDSGIVLGEVLGGTIQDTVIPMLDRLIEGIAKLAEWFANLSPFWQKFIISALGILAALGPVLIVVGKIVSAIGVLIPIVSKIIAAVKVVGAVIGGVISGPVALIIAAIAAIGIAVYFIIKYWEPIKEFFKKLWEGIKKVFSAVWEWIKDLFLKYHPVGILITHWEEIKEFFAGLWDTVKELAAAAWEWLKDLFLRYHPVGLVIKHWDTIKEFFTNLWDRVKKIFSGAMSAVGGFITDKFNAVVSFLTGIRDRIVGIFQTVKDRIVSIWGAIVGAIKGAINSVIAVINGMIGSINRIHVNIPAWVPKYGGASIGFNIPGIPYLAKGGDILRAGAAIVGEQGPELVNLPRGAQVQPLKGGAQEVRHSGTITIRGVSDQGQLVGVVDAVIERLIAEVRA